MALYNVTINGLIDFPGDPVWIDDVFTSKFNLIDWEPETGGVEFDLPASLFPKPYQLDDFQVEIINDLFRFDTGTATRYLEVSAADAIILNTHYFDQLNLGLACFVWMKHVKLELTYIVQQDYAGRWLAPLTLSSIINSTTEEYDYLNAYLDNTENRYTVTKYCKTFTGCKVRIYNMIGDNGFNDNGDIVFAGRLSEPPTCSDSIFHFTAKDEIDCLDVPIPKTDPTATYGLTIYSLLSPDAYFAAGYIKTSGTIFQGEYAKLSGYSRSVTTDDYEHSLIDETLGSWGTFLDFWKDYLKLTHSMLVLASYSGRFPFWSVVSVINTTSVVSELDLSDYIDVSESIECELSNGIGLVKMEYDSQEYVLNNVFSMNYGEDRSFDLNLPAGLELVMTYPSVFAPLEFLAFFLDVFAVMYQKIIMMTDDRATTGILIGSYYSFNDWSLAQCNDFVETGVSNKFLCITNSENKVEFIQVEDV